MHYLYGSSDRCQPCVRCMEGVRNSEGPLWEVSLYLEISIIIILSYSHNRKGVPVQRKYPYISSLYQEYIIEREGECRTCIPNDAHLPYH